jgi:UDP-glucuronate 4-epimerase
MSPGIERLFAAEQFERVIHLAAQAGVRYSLQNPHAYVDSNLVGFVNMLEGCRHNRRRALGLRVELQRLRRQHPHAVLRA